MNDASSIITTELVYMGRRISDSKVVYAYRGDDDREVLYLKTLMPAVGPGAIIATARPADQPGMVYTRGEHAPRLLGFWDRDPEVLAQWQAADIAARETAAMHSATRKTMANATPVKDAIDALAAAGAALPRHQRAAFAQFVSDAIRGI